jgi:hypothetical protein
MIRNRDKDNLDYFDNLLSPDDIASKLDEPAVMPTRQREPELRVSAGQDEQLQQLDVEKAILNELKKMNGLLHEILKKLESR